MSQYELGQFIKNNVLPKNLKQSVIANQLEVTRQTLSRLFNGHTTLSEEMANKLSKAYGADSEDLLSRQRAVLGPKRALVTKSIRNYTSKFWDISADDISDYFGRKKIGRDIFPQLIRMLVRSQNTSLTKCDFHAGDNAERKGWDGETIAEKATTNVPAGYTIWELGTNNDPRRKAESDYNKSLEKKASLNEEKRLKTTYVFVTPYHWEKAKDWAKGKTALGDYANVIAFDASGIEQWLEEHPGVQAWFAEKLGIPTNGIRTLESFWDEWSKTAEPAISPLMFKSAVDSSVKKLSSWLVGDNNNPFSIQAGTREEVGAFLGAAGLLDEKLKDLLTNCVIVDEKADLPRLAASSIRLIPVALDASAARACIRAFSDRPIIVSRDSSRTTQDDADLNIDLPDREFFVKSLLAMGIDESKTDQLVTQTNCSPTILRRSLAKLPEDKLPQWANQLNNFRPLVPAFLAGSWQKRKADDIAFVEALAKSCGIDDYQEVERELVRLSHMEESPVWIESDFRGVTSKLESLLVLGPYITEEILDEFIDLCELLLSEYDPALELEKENRWAAAIYNKTRKSSCLLRKSITHTLIILSVHGQSHLSAASSSNIQYKIDRLIANLLSDGSVKNWLSQNGLLRMYAEASPDSFIRAVKRELYTSKSVFDEMFLPVDSRSFGASPDRTNLLWALEVLAWSKDHVVDACNALAELCRYPCNDNWANKPLACLNDILLYWRPHTCLNLSQRKKLLNQLYKNYPDIAWKLATNPFSNGGFTSGTCKPKYRDWASGIKESITYEEAWEYQACCLEVLLSHSPYTTDNIKQLVELLDGFPENSEEKVLHIFSEWKVKASKEEFIEVRELIRTRTRTRQSIRRREKKKQSGQRYFDGEKILTILQPKDILEKHAWLFLKSYVDESLDEIEENSDIDFETRDRRINNLRQCAIREIWEQCGGKGLSQLVELSKDSFIVGHALSSIDIPENELVDFLAENFVKSESNMHSNGAHAVQGILRNKKVSSRKLFSLTQEHIKGSGMNFDAAAFCTLMNFNNETLQFVSKLDQEAQFNYWKTVFPHYFQDSDIDLNELIHQLLDVDRPLAALFAAKHYSKQIETSVLLKLLRAVLSSDSQTEPNFQLDRYRISELVAELQTRTDVEQGALASIEFSYAPILTVRRKKNSLPTLTKVLFSDPKQYFQLIALCYYRKDRKDDFAELGLPESESHRRKLAETARHVLENLSEIPGFIHNDIPQKIEAAIGWINSVLDLANEFDRLEVTKLKIGNVLAGGKEGKDGIWPCEHVRGILEHYQDDDIISGLETEKLNSRGVIMRARPYNGDQERQIAHSFFKNANLIAIEYPFTANVLRDIGKCYENDGKRYDNEGRLERRISE